MADRAGIYGRISKDRDGTHAGVRRQEADCRELAQRRGWPVADVYVDDDISAYSGRARPEYRRMLDDITEGRIDAVVVWHLDRLHRHPRELEEFLEVCDRARLTALATVTGDVDLATHDGQLVARIMGAVARKESDDKSRRIRRKKEELARDGKPSGGGARPFGYEVDRLTVRPGEAAVLRDVAARVLAGESIRSLCADLDQRGVLTTGSKQWHPTVLRRILLSPRVAGLRLHRGEVIGPAQWPAILAVCDYNRLCAVLTDPARTTHTPRRYVLSGGMLRCGLCGTGLVSRPRSDGKRRYLCANGPGKSGCGRLSIVADDVEEFITAAVLHHLDGPELAAALAGGDTTDDGVQQEVDAAQAHLDELADAYADELITLKEWLRARKPIERRLELARKRLSRLTRTSALDGYVGNSDQLRAQWTSLDLSRQRAILAAVLDHVIVSPSPGCNRFDPARLQPVWRV